VSRRPARSADERAERRRRARLGQNARKRIAGPRPQATGPVVIPSEARMMANLDAAWGDAEPGEDGLTVDRPLRHPEV